MHKILYFCFYGGILCIVVLSVNTMQFYMLTEMF